MSDKEKIQMLKNDNYLLTKKIEKKDRDIKELQKQLKESERNKRYWKEAYNRIKGD